MATIAEVQEIVNDLDKRLTRIVEKGGSSLSPIYLKTINKLIDQMTKLNYLKEMEEAYEEYNEKYN